MLGVSCVSGKNYCYCSTGDTGRSRAAVWGKSPERTLHDVWVGPAVAHPKGLQPPQHRGKGQASGQRGRE